MINEPQALENEQDNIAGFDGQSEVLETTPIKLTHFFAQLLEFRNTEATEFQKLPAEFRDKMTQTHLEWHNLTTQEQYQRLDEFLAKRDDIMRDLATTYFQQYEGYTMLNMAAFKGKDQIVESLLIMGADVNEAGNKYRKTALHWGVTNCNWNIVRACIEHGANTQLRNGNGETALEHAEGILPQVENFNLTWLGQSEEERNRKPAECRNIVALLKKHEPTRAPGVHYMAPGLNGQASGAAVVSAQENNSTNESIFGKCSIQ